MLSLRETRMQVPVEEQRKEGGVRIMFIPMTMSPEEANAEIDRGKVDSSVVSEVEKILCREKLTPLQAQAVLTAAWDWITRHGLVTGWEK